MVKRTARKYSPEQTPTDRRLRWLIMVAGAFVAAGLLLMLWRVISAAAAGEAVVCWLAC
ncbi:MAG: hypothetical protein ACTHLT_05870 [Devosia sp.]